MSRDGDIGDAVPLPVDSDQDITQPISAPLPPLSDTNAWRDLYHQNETRIRQPIPGGRTWEHDDA